MLKPEQAHKELEKIKVEGWHQDRLAALKKLPKTSREVARPLVGASDDGEDYSYQEHGKLREEVLPLAAGMTGDQRMELFQALFPGLAAAVEAGWQLHNELPHSMGGWQTEVKSFRIPGNDGVLLKRRLRWVESLLGCVGPYPGKDLIWFATWAGHIGWGSEPLAILLAAAIDAGGQTGDEIFEILCASARGEHEIGIMGQHVLRALLCASRPDGWEFVEKLLLAAQREEGLRQAILESVDAARPETFRRILRVILDNNLVRFSATVRALDVWLGYMWDSVSTGVANAVIEKLLLYLEDANARSAALKGKDAEQAYLALWTIAFDNALAAVEPAGALLKHPKAEFRFVAARLLGQMDLPSAQAKLHSILEDQDLHMPYCALVAHQYGDLDEALLKSDFFERLEKLIKRFPEKATKLKELVWPWTGYAVDRSLISSVMLKALGSRPATRLIPHLGDFSSSERGAALKLLAETEKVGGEARDAFLAWIGDASRSVREAAIAGLQKCSLLAGDAPTLENLLTRTAGDLRRGILQLLFKQADEAVLASADRLLDASSAPQRLAGLELLRQLTDCKRCLAEARERASTYSKARPTLAEAERQQIENIVTARTETLTLENALGLVKHEDRTWPANPVNKKVALHSAAAVRLIQALDDLVHEHREVTITIEQWDNEESKEQKLLGEVDYGFQIPKEDKILEQDRARLPLLEVWEEWWAKRKKDLRDADGFEVLRAFAWFECGVKDPRTDDDIKLLRKRCPEVMRAVYGEYPRPELKHDHIVMDLLRWLHRLHPAPGTQDFLLDVLETIFALVPESELRHMPNPDDYSRDDFNWRDYSSPLSQWRELVNWDRRFAAAQWTPAQHGRLFRLLRWADEPFGRENNLSDRGTPISRDRADLGIMANSHAVGAASDSDVFDQFLGPREEGRYGGGSFDELTQLTSRSHSKELLTKFPALRPLMERCRARVLEVEITRGDSATAASKPAMAIKSVYGIANLVNILRVLGEGNFKRGWAYDSEDKETVLSHLVRACFPAEDETPADFAKQVMAAQIPESRLVELALYAPQWVTHVELALGWKSFVDAVWWIHAHTKGTDWSVDEEIREAWKADLSRRTALTSEELLEGAVDVDWFNRVYADLAEKRWAVLDEAAKYASTGAGHARARLFADAMLNRVKKKELLTRVRIKRYQDGIRALGLLPLAGGKSREADLLDRYKAMQEFIRTSRQFGSQRQASEKRAAQIGQENLARTAGYPDPIRLQWAMEARAVADLAEGPISVQVEGVTVSLGIDPWGEVEFSVVKDGKALADLPPKLKKDKKVAALRERKTELKRQASRIRIALEQFMCRGETVTGAELQELMKHPILAPMLGGLVLLGEGVLGYPVHGGKALQDCDGNKEALKKDEKIRIAHPMDLLPAAKWHAWQKDCFAKERIQPFKQVFRELYTLTKPEKDEGTQSRRYAGHQVQPRKALALLGARGWVHHPEEGVRKTYHDAGITVWLEFDEPFFTPAEIEGLTLESVHFTKRSGDSKPLKLAELPPRLFSETMRDLDLVVSVAHRGGVDPEASASTLEMRAALVKETCSLLKLSNVRIKDNAVLIKGELADYTVHLGSAIARKIPGETLFIVAVQAQHRGRLFLPFADNDPRTAEVVSKVLLLARDKEIKDPSIINQIRAG
ncbi:MAG: hypothetical protein C5B50_04960 [Verrucomicrobia bacterium]|nr:MAG: hypothetical protein C5B50_04960 [Verrucomicrobiota bacterium]